MQKKTFPKNMKNKNGYQFSVVLHQLWGIICICESTVSHKYKNYFGVKISKKNNTKPQKTHNLRAV